MIVYFTVSFDLIYIYIDIHAYIHVTLHCIVLQYIYIHQIKLYDIISSSVLLHQLLP